jgi:SulP family sulfate permease
MWKEYWALIQKEFAGYGLHSLRRDVLAGCTVAAVALPLALAFGVASGADAAAGLVTAIAAGIIIGLLGGAPYQISGPTGAMSAVLIIVAARYGPPGIWVAGLMAGVMMVILGILRLGRVVSLIPAPVISGFTSGVAVIIVAGQLHAVMGMPAPQEEHLWHRLRSLAETARQANPQALLACAVVVLTMAVWPRLPRLRAVPASLVGIVAATIVAGLMGDGQPVIGSIPRSILLEQHLRLSDIEWEMAGALLVPAMSIAALGAIESLLCGAVAGNMTGIRMHNSIELTAQGAGNILIPFLGGVPATAAIARTSVNVKSGAVTRLASVAHGLVLLASAILFAPWLERIPLAALGGVLVVTAWRMNEWHAIRFYFGRRIRHAMAAFVVTLAATVLLDLTQAIVIGFGISSLVFMAQVADLQVVRQPVDLNRLKDPPASLRHHPDAISVYYVTGPLFFAAARKLLEKVEAIDPPGAVLILSLRGVPLVDATGMEVLRELIHRQRNGNGELLLSSLAPKVERLLERSGLMDELGRERVFWSTDRAILSLGAPLPKPVEATTELAPEGPELDSTLVITPHEDRKDQQF